MNPTVYLVDTNALVALRRERISSVFFLTHCRVTDDVLREAREHPDAALFTGSSDLSGQPASHG